MCVYSDITQYERQIFQIKNLICCESVDSFIMFGRVVILWLKHVGVNFILTG